jgi:hypothetical protein
MSLPAMSTLARFGSSPPTRGSGTSPQQSSGLTQMMDRRGELVGKESIVATWNLKRGREWREIKQPLHSTDAARSSRISRPQ